MVKRAVREQLPDVIDRLVAHIESGVGFDQAAWTLSKEVDNELSRAFGAYLEEVKSAFDAGRCEGVRREALLNMARRFDVPELDGFVAAVIRADEQGVSLLETLKDLSAGFQEQR